MKQAGADAEELIGTYRGEKQQEFNNKVLAAGKLSWPPHDPRNVLSIKRGSDNIHRLSFLPHPTSCIYPDFLNLTGGSGGSASAKLQAKTNRETQAMQAMFGRNAQKAVDVLLSKCCEVSLEVPTARVRATQKIYS